MLSNRCRIGWARAAVLVLAATLATGAAARVAAQDAAQDVAPQSEAAVPAGDAQAVAGDAMPQSFDAVQSLIGVADDAGKLVFTYENRDIAPMRMRIFGRTPAERAAAATYMLDKLVEAQTISPVSVRPIPGGALVFVAGVGVLGIADGDLSVWGDTSAGDSFARVESSLNQALQEAVEARSPHQLLVALMWAGIATLLLVLALTGLRALSANFVRRLKRHEDADAERLAGRPVDVTSYGMNWLLVALLRAGRVLAFALALMCLWVWLTFTLLQFPYLRPIGESLDENLMTLVLRALDATLTAIPDLIVAALILVATRFVVRGTNSFFHAVKAGRVSVNWIGRDVAESTRRIVSFALWIFAAVLTYPYLPGSGTEAFKGVTVFLGLVFSLGSTGTVGQVVAGLMLMYSRIVSLGDYVRIGEAEGTVTSIGLLATRLRTVYEEELVIPNSVVMGGTTLNYSRFRDKGGVRITTEVTIGYDAPWRQVHGMLLRAAALTPGLRADPAPQVLQTALSDFYVEYKLTACIEVPEQRIPVLSVLHRNIQDQFNEHGVQIMSPHFMANPSHPVVVPKERWRDAPADPSAG